MLNSLRQRSVTLEWISPAPVAGKKSALLIPVYNESSHCDMMDRLSYFDDVAAGLKKDVDVIIIDDGSTDDSLKKMKAFLADHPGGLYIASITPNANKVGALFLTILSISHEFIILSDFDTDIVGIKDMEDISISLREDDSLMGCYFRMLPYEGAGRIFRFQQLEYSLIRTLYKFHHKEQSVPVMPGAGSCYKREVLIAIYQEHSGFRSGEDREATLIGMKLGYKTIYKESILTLTRPPLSFRSLIKQRVRWNLGYLETFAKERKYYFSQISRFTRVGVRTLLDIVITFFLLSVLPLIIMTSLISFQFFLISAIGIYLITIIWCINLLFIGPEEVSGLERGKIFSILTFPFMKMSVEYLAWMGAVREFSRKQTTSRIARNARKPESGNTIYPN
jgi:cellulose synthase/poly-beta-1,6-N-acetylglucosamine synthase-like glycosyltransferase